MAEKMRSLGVCLGASTVSIVALEAESTTTRMAGGVDFRPTAENPKALQGFNRCGCNPACGGMQSSRFENNQSNPGPEPALPCKPPRVIAHYLYPHDGDPKRTLQNAFERLDLSTCDRIAATGRKFRKFVNLSAISEPEAVEYAYRHVKPPDVDCPAVVSAGGETFMVYVLDGGGRIANVITGNKCASGTGEFFLQQLRRMNATLEDAAQWAAVETPYHVSGRCSVFCKSDCTHATNKGIPKAQVTAGLCLMMANKVLELLKKVERRNVMLTGGTAKNHMMVDYLRREIPGLIIPRQAPYFEALGAALWALEHETAGFPGMDRLFHEGVAAFDSLPPLRHFENQVEFKNIASAGTAAGDVCLLGLDVGSTTTKAVLIRRDDDALLASVYLRTNGDPVGASRQCYRSILAQISAQVDPASIRIIGLGVCGSGRQIAGLHALTDAVINEIIAHATAAVYFDPQVDTIFEIGGQDAKYTYITNGVPSDYAMNEACSAGTGSFLEESALESLGVPMKKIAEVALSGDSPPNFNDQCAAFIASDIKNAIHEGMAHEDIVAGLVYSICMNYSNRVKGNRPVGEKVFMQGGVCYNRAVPLAMASLVGKPIIVPPEPGLMGAFGVALAVKNRISSGLLAALVFDLKTLADRTVAYGKSFTCKGGKEKCDRRCEIAVIAVEGKKYPFGGACNRYYNLRRNMRYNIESLDLVRLRQRLVFETFAAWKPSGPVRGKIGINRSFLVNTYFPLYSNFLVNLGFEVLVPAVPAQEGIDQRNTAFCYPAELAHGFFYSLLESGPKPDYLFLPHFKAVPGLDKAASAQSQVCPLVQGEPFYLQTTFRKKIDALKKTGVRLLQPLIDLNRGLENAEKPLLQMAKQLGVGRRAAKAAFDAALERQRACQVRMREIGSEALRVLESDPEKFAVVIFARPYNGFVEEAHMGIPHKFASRGIMVLPIDFLDLEAEPAKRHMYWGMGQLILKASRRVRRHPQLFGTYITNFSCGPDSFVIGYFRDIMGRKPSLTLELDSHTADAGLETRVEAFLDIATAYRQLLAARQIVPRQGSFRPAQAKLNGAQPEVLTSSGDTLPMTDPRVTVLIPSMGRHGTEAFAALLRGYGMNAVAHRESDEAVLKLGRAHTSCKECLPLILTTGTLLSYIRNGKRPDEVLVYFMPTGSGPCRFGQYGIFMEDLIRRLEIPDVAMFALTAENSYAGMDKDFERRAWWAVVVSDIMEDIRSMLLANAVDTKSALLTFDRQWQAILSAVSAGHYPGLERQLQKSAASLGRIPQKRPPETVPVITLAGEIFVRRDSLSRQFLTEQLAGRGFATICSPVAEWVKYCNWIVDRGLNNDSIPGLQRLKLKFRNMFQNRYERRIQAILASSNLVHAEPIEVDTLIKNASAHISPQLQGEAILTVGGSITEIVTSSCGVIAIGPFGCMPNRLSEAILNETMTATEKLATEPADSALRAVLTDIEELPFLAIESDGSPFPQVISAKLETFCLRAERLHARMLAAGDSRRPQPRVGL